MKAELRPYQVKCVDEVKRAHVRGKRRVLYVQATGTGKTVVFCRLVDEFVREFARPALVIAHRDELLEQAARRIAKDCPGFIVSQEGGKEKADPKSHVIVASVQSIGRLDTPRLKWLGAPSLIVCDEAHHAAAKGYQNVFERFGAYDGRSFLVGCTATPKRLDRKALTGMHGATFEEQVFEYSLRQGIEEGYLCKLRGYRVITDIDISEVGSNSEDFKQGELSNAVNVTPRTNRAIDHWFEVAATRKTIVFCASVQHAKDVSDAWRERGIAAECVYGALAKDERKEILKRLASGQTQVVTNCEVLTEGFDQPDVSCIVMLRPTTSWAMYMQMVGRGTRIHEGKDDCIIIDVVDNCTKHSLATMPGILDLPPNLDLEGESITDVAKKIEDAGANAARISDCATLEELETRLESVDFFADIETPATVAQFTHLNWLAVPGGYYLSCGANRSVRLIQDHIGDYQFTAHEGDKIYPTHNLGEVAEFAFERADAKIIKVWPEVSVIASRKARWRKEPVTDGQRKMLKWKLRMKSSEIDKLTKGQASSMIDRAMQKI